MTACHEIRINDYTLIIQKSPGTFHDLNSGGYIYFLF